MRTNNIPNKENRKDSLFCLLAGHNDMHSLARTSHLEYIFMAPKVFEPLKFYCMWRINRLTIKLLKIGAAKIIIVTVPKMEQFDFTYHISLAKRRLFFFSKQSQIFRSIF